MVLRSGRASRLRLTPKLLVLVSDSSSDDRCKRFNLADSGLESFFWFSTSSRCRRTLLDDSGGVFCRSMIGDGLLFRSLDLLLSPLCFLRIHGLGVVERTGFFVCRVGLLLLLLLLLLLILKVDTSEAAAWACKQR